MKVLLYNFVQPDETGKQGGGVAVYQKNLARALADAGHNIISLSAGDRYTLLDRKPFLKVRKSTKDGITVNQVHLYNSPVFAPAHSSFYRLEDYVDSRMLDHIPMDLKRHFGSIDVFHFQNIEGLTASFFESLRATFPQSRIILSAHNYNLVCPQVNLWFRETISCVDYREGHACVNCIGGFGGNPQEKNIRRMDTLIAHVGVRRHGRVSKMIEYGARLPFRLRRLLQRQSGRIARQALIADTASAPRTIVSPALASPYRRYRARNIQIATTVFDHVIAVSERTRDVLVRHGVPKDFLAVSYIGTAHQARFLRSTRKMEVGRQLHIAYLGYMRADKGFFFFIECLHLIPEAVARTMAVTIAVPYGSAWPVEQLKAMAQKFNQLKLYNGYSHASLDDILADVTLGIVPVLWEDNLPQVAIEIVSRGIPILTSDKGGAQEIASSPDFTFRAGSRHDFVDKLRKIAVGTIRLSSFWAKPIRIFSMDDHVTDLMRFYGPGSDTAADIPHRRAISA